MPQPTLEKPLILTKLFKEFFDSEKAGGLILIFCTIASLLLANSPWGKNYLDIWHLNIFYRSVEFWINDGLMTIFFLLVGLEIEREIYVGELSKIKQAMLPVIAAVGGMIVPAAIHFAFNYGTASQDGFAIPMATDIAFSLGVLALLGSRVPASLKVFLTALAIVDDLGAIAVIALFYSKNFSFVYFGLAALIFAIMLGLNRANFMRLWVYLGLGIVMWFCMYNSGIHPSITGVLLAFALPFGSGDEHSISYQMEEHLDNPVAFFILPLFALANTALVISPAVFNLNPNTLGIFLGLIIGKPLGIFASSVVGSALGLCSIPSEIKKIQLLGIGIVAGIGFTVSIFITLLAFTDQAMIDSSKLTILIAAIFSGVIGYMWLRVTLTDQETNERATT